MAAVPLASCFAITPGALETTVRQVFASIDRVHFLSDAFGNVKTPITYTNDARFGAYVPERNGDARHIALSQQGPHPALTLAHEVGHWLDHALGGFRIYASEQANDKLSDVLSALGASRAVREMRQELQALPSSRRAIRFQLQYWLTQHELWARAYAQYIALRSDNAELRQQIQISMQMNEQGPIVYRNVQWEDADFAPVDSAIDDAFRRLQWIR